MNLGYFSLFSQKFNFKNSKKITAAPKKRPLFAFYCLFIAIPEKQKALPSTCLQQSNIGLFQLSLSQIQRNFQFSLMLTGTFKHIVHHNGLANGTQSRSEERRVGKEC